MTAPLNTARKPPYRVAGLVLAALLLGAGCLVYVQFRGGFSDTTPLTLWTGRSGLVMDPGSKVTYNGAQIGRVSAVTQAEIDGAPTAELTLQVDPKYIPLIPRNVDAAITASTVFGNKYVSFTSPKMPSVNRITSKDVIDARSVTTEFNTLFETVTQLSEQVDPVELNMTLSATAEALTGLGTRFGQSIAEGDRILGDLNQRMPQFRSDVKGLARLADIYSDASPNLWTALGNAVTTARTLNEQRGPLDAALLAAVGFGRTGADVVGRAAPYLVRGVADLTPSAKLLDQYSPELFCTVRNFAESVPAAAAALGGNGYSLNSMTQLVGAPNPYSYPDNLPRLNAHGGPGGAPGCWQPINSNLWPAPYLVMDTGASIAPYNHLGVGQPVLTEYVWGRQLGENTINP